MNEPPATIFKKFLVILMALILMDIFLVTVIPTKEATIVLIGSFQTSVNSLLFIIANAFIVISVGRKITSRSYTRGLGLVEGT